MWGVLVGGVVLEWEREGIGEGKEERDREGDGGPKVQTIIQIGFGMSIYGLSLHYVCLCVFLCICELWWKRGSREGEGVKGKNCRRRKRAREVGFYFIFFNFRLNFFFFFFSLQCSNVLILNYFFRLK
jgi:hypothetical protein